MPETIQSSIDLKARKPHVCSYCLQNINKDTVYERSVLKYDGDLYVWKNHKYCQQIAERLRMFDDCDEGVTSSDFSEYINEKYNDIYDSPERKTFQERLFIVLDHYKIEHP